jgi:NADPH:quinone reductase-like Zn-dependent oxidoreductase
MKAARLHAYGPADVLVIDNVPQPTVGPGELRVQVGASSVNPVDTKLRRGALKVVMRWSLPHTTGLDCAGTVLEVAPGVTGFSVGDRVFCPDNLTDAQAASLPLVALTAYDCLVRSANVQPGEKVLILGGAGGVGTVAIQMAKALGADVSVTASPRNRELVLKLGADHVVDYTKERPEDVLPPQDVVLIAVGGDGGRTAIRASRKGARLAHIVGDLPKYVDKYGHYLGTLAAGLTMAHFWLSARISGRTGANVVKKSEGLALSKVADWVEQGVIQPVIDSTYALADVADAHRRVESGKVQGKVVIIHDA